jgi:hypothetical protein
VARFIADRREPQSTKDEKMWIPAFAGMTNGRREIRVRGWSDERVQHTERPGNCEWGF